MCLPCTAREGRQFIASYFHIGPGTTLFKKMLDWAWPTRGEL